ncbi:MAG: protein BatD [Magnetococcales bacterium]|nr:protein BatD [Magnetococcales bacterium]
MVNPTRFAIMPALLFWLAIHPLWAGEIQARTSRDPVRQSESFALIFSTGESPDGDPDFAPLGKDFDILDQQKSTNFQFINGHKSHSITWTVELLPKRGGEIAIPPIAFGKDRSTPLTVNVQSGAGKSDSQAGTPEDAGLLLETELSNKTPYLQEQTILTLRFLNAVPIAGASLAEPKILKGDAVIEKLGEDQAFETTRQGRRFVATERRYALFPQRSGTLELEPVPLTVQMPGQGGSNLLKEFLSDPFIRNLPLGAGRPGRTVRLSSQPLQLEPKAIPSSWHGSPWLPAHRLILAEKWSPDPPRFQAGEPVTRTITLMADGLTAAQLPGIPQKSLENLKLYPDRPLSEDQKTPTGIIGKRTEKLAILPATPGEHILPAIEIPWWNIDTQKAEVARLPERRITVLPAPGGTQTPAPTAQAPVSPEPVQPKAEVPPPPPISPKPVPSPVTGASASPANQETLWPWVALGCGLGWLGTALWWWRSARNRRTSLRIPSGSRPDPDKLTRQALQKLRSACEANDPRQAQEALSQVPQWRSPAMEMEISRLNAAMYAPNASPWQGGPLWAACQAAQQAAQAKPAPGDPNLLPPLYPS